MDKCDMIGGYLSVLLNSSSVRLAADKKQVQITDEFERYMHKNGLQMNAFDPVKLNDFLAYFLIVRVELISQAVSHVWKESPGKKIIKACASRALLNFFKNPDSMEVMASFYLIYVLRHNEDIRTAYPDLLDECIRRSGFQYTSKLDNFFYPELIYFDSLLKEWCESLFTEIPVSNYYFPEISDSIKAPFFSFFHIVKKILSILGNAGLKIFSIWIKISLISGLIMIVVLVILFIRDILR